MNSANNGIISRLKSAVLGLSSSTPTSDKPVCRHETHDIFPDEDESIWCLVDSYLKGEPYWTAHDAAFLKTRERVKEFRCFGCGEQRTITTGEVIGVRWKADMTTEELAEMHEQTNGGSWYNGKLWWEDNEWDGDVIDVATDLDWRIDVGYTEWKERVDHNPEASGVDADT
jgi:hypothetical protein